MPENESLKLCCCIICFVFVFIILALAVCWSNKDTFENFGNMMKRKNNYHRLKPTEDIVSKLRGPSLVAITAPWCGHCKRLKASGVLSDVAKKYPVIEIDDKHPQTGDLLKNLDAGGFPTLAIFNKGNMTRFTRKDPMAALDQMTKSSSSCTCENKNKECNCGKIVNIPETATFEELEQQVSGKKKAVLMFLADWCGHCKRLKASGLIDDLSKAGATVYIADDKCSLAKGVSGYPTIKVRKNGSWRDHEGSRTVDSIMA